jgi:hypothetical protein
MDGGCARRRGALMTCRIRVPENVHFVVAFPVAHNRLWHFDPGLSASALSPWATIFRPFRAKCKYVL